VLLAFNETLGLTARYLMGGRPWADRYMAHVCTLHEWSKELDNTTVQQIEWIMFKHNRAARLEKPTSH